ncbi:hypothetical protein FXF51_56720 [Nonomuraea sp. PA05]|uniref:hypothetical protein n=1 Tax=Nonomuraea sp. PA05 TaxID=2604466 RepID=UPI0011D92BA1|nr:hypothetical protein [Nonomuraea sp. PA05]TYB50226.1 hypothetical protein FXF51_56720 [Nonomuraea sp. PA05]
MSMPIDPFPVGESQIVRELARRVAALESRLGVQPAVQISASSGPLFIPNSGVPDTPSGGCRVYAVGGELRVIQSNGSVRQIPAQGGSVTTPTVNLSNAPASYSQTWAQDLAASTSSIFQSYANASTGLLTILRTAGIIAT